MSNPSPQLNRVLLDAQKEYIPISQVLLSGVSTAQISPLYYPGGRVHHTVQVDATAGTTFSLAIEGSLDNQNFYAIGSPVTAAGLAMITGTYSALRANLTSVSGGSVTVTVRSQR